MRAFTLAAGRLCRWCGQPLPSRRGRPGPLCCRVWARISVAGPDECWMWIGRMHENGYGVIDMPGKGGPPRYAHRIVFILETKSQPEEVMHACDRPRCCNPRHLAGGTHRLNMIDMQRKGRHRNPGMPGSKNPAALITEPIASEIRKRYAAGGISQRALGAEYGVSRGVVSGVVYRKNWRHVA